MWQSIKDGTIYYGKWVIHIIFAAIIIPLSVGYYLSFDESTEELNALKSITERGFTQVSSLDYVDSSLEGQIVFIHGAVKTPDILYDPNFAISKHALCLYTTTKYYQWDEDRGRRNRLRGYQLERHREVVDSSLFEDYKNNTLTYPVENFAVYAPTTTLGAYSVAPSLVAEFPEKLSLDIQPTQTLLESAQEKILSYADTQTHLSESLLHYKQQDYKGSLVHINSNLVYLGLDPFNPQSGDIEVQYYYIPEQTVSFFAELKGSTLHLFTNENGDSARQVIVAGKADMHELFETVKRDNKGSLSFILISIPLIIFMVIFIDVRFVLRVAQNHRDSKIIFLRNNFVLSVTLTTVLIAILSGFALYF